MSVPLRSIRAVPRRQSDIDACPGALRLFAAADGPLARVRLPGGLLTGAQLAELGAIAAELGDGHLELTSRANVQLRALVTADPTALAGRLTGAGLLPSVTHEVVRNIAAPPLSDPPTRALIHHLDESLCADDALTALPGRFLFAIGATGLVADVAAIPAGPAYAILLAGQDEGLRVPADKTVTALLAAAHAFLELQATIVPPPWRLAEIPNGPARVAAMIAPSLAASPTGDALPHAGAVAMPRMLVGVLDQGDGLVAVGATVPLGRLTAEQIALLATADRLVLTPSRGVVIPDLAPAQAAHWLTALTAAGLPTAPDSRWSGVTACAGRPGCAKSLADVRADALAATRFVEGLPVHWIGCARGCGSPAGPHVRVEAAQAGYLVTIPATGRGQSAIPPRSVGDSATSSGGKTTPPPADGAKRMGLADIVAKARKG